MPQPNRISITIPQAEHDQVMQHLAAIRSLLKPYLIPLTADDRSTLAKMGDKTQPFVRKALEYAKTNPAFVPPSVDVTEWQKDFDGWEDISPIKNQLNQLASDADDTAMLLGSEALDPARWYYKLVALAVERGDPSAKPVHEDLAQRFAGQGRKKKAVAAK